MFSKISPVAKYPIASVYLYKHYVLYKKYVLYKNLLIFREFFNTHSDQNILQNTPNCTTRIAIKNPPSKAHGFAMRSMSLRDMQISKSEKKILGPLLPNPGDAPAMLSCNSPISRPYTPLNYIHLFYVSAINNIIYNISPYYLFSFVIILP